MNGQPKYPFLDLLKEADAIARGANLADKVIHAVYKAVRTLSTPDAVKQNALFTLEVVVPGVVNMTRKDLQTVLNKLISDRLVAQIFRLDFEPGSAPRPVACFITVPPDEKGTIVQLYTETLFSSIRALETYIESLPSPGAEGIWKDFETDFNSERGVPPGDLSSTLVDLFVNIHAGKFGVVPPPELITTTLGELEDALIRKGRVFKIIDYGLMIIREADALTRFEAAADFFQSKVIPKYRSRGNLKKELEAITMEESLYYADDFAVQTAEFIVRKASAVKKTILAEPTRGKGVRYQGALAVETILALESFTRSAYQEKWKSEMSRMHMEFRQKLLRPGRSWKDKVFFIEEKDVASYPPDVWKRIIDDPEILHGVWERLDTTVHVFIQRDPSAFRLLIAGIGSLPPSLHWQILAVKNLLEKHEDEFEELFEDGDFVSSYGKILRTVYIQLIPWFYRIFILLGLNWFQDRAFHIAKQKIGVDQRVRAEKNRVKNEALRTVKETEKKMRLARIKDMESSNRIVEKIDQFLNQESRIPNVGDVKAMLPEIDAAQYQEILKREKFQIIPFGKGDGPDLNLLLYPLNHEWRTKVARLRRTLDRLLVSGESSDPSLAEKIKLIQKFISRTEKAVEEGEGEDPYARFEKELKKHEKIEGQEDDEEELEV